MSKKWLCATLLSFYGFCPSLTLTGSKARKIRKPEVFIRSDAHAVRAGISLRVSRLALLIFYLQTSAVFDSFAVKQQQLFRKHS